MASVAGVAVAVAGVWLGAWWVLGGVVLMIPVGVEALLGAYRRAPRVTARKCCGVLCAAAAVAVAFWEWSVADEVRELCVGLLLVVGCAALFDWPSDREPG